MPMKIKVAGEYRDVQSAYVKVNGEWKRVRIKVKVNGEWKDANVVTQQFPAVKTRSYDGGTVGHPYPDGTFTIVSIDEWTNSTTLRQGRYSYTWSYEWPPEIGGAVVETCYHGPYYGTMHFGSGAGTPTALAGRVVVAARIYVRRTSSLGSGDDPITLYATTLTDVPGSGAHSPNGNVTGSPTVIATLAPGAGGWYDLPLTLAAEVIAGRCLAIYTGNDSLAELYGVENATHKPVIEISSY
jgi:hypothetical protein